MVKIRREILALLGELMFKIKKDAAVIKKIDAQYPETRKGTVEKLKNIEFQRYCMRKYELQIIAEKLLDILDADIKNERMD